MLSKVKDNKLASSYISNILTRKTASCAARASMSAHETMPLQAP